MPIILTGKAEIKSIFDPAAIATLTDRELHKQAQFYGDFSRSAQKKFAAFLPEINKRKLYLKHKFYSIHHYAAVIGGLSKPVVDEILRVATNLKDKPILQKLIVDQGWSKLKVVATIATTETQQMWAEKVTGMSKSTLETFVRELKKQRDFPVVAEDLGNGIMDAEVVQNEKMAAAEASLTTENIHAGIYSFRPGAEFAEQTESSSAHAAVVNSLLGDDSIQGNLTNGQFANQNSRTAMSFKIDLETEKQLRLFRYKLEKQSKRPQDFNAVIRQLLRIAHAHEGCEKVETKGAIDICKSDNAKCGKAHNSNSKPIKGHSTVAKRPNPIKLIRAITKQKIKKTINEKSTRPIPAVINQFLKEESGEMCEYPGCKKPAEIQHHLDRYALIPSHDPEKIALLCKEHERLAHLGLIKNEGQKPNSKSLNLKNETSNTNWKIQTCADKTDPKYKIDQIVNKFRRHMAS